MRTTPRFSPTRGMKSQTASGQQSNLKGGTPLHLLRDYTDVFSSFISICHISCLRKNFRIFLRLAGSEELFHEHLLISFLTLVFVFFNQNYMCIRFDYICILYLSNDTGT